MELLEITPGVHAMPAAHLDPGQLASFVQRNREHLAPFLPAVAAIDTPAAAQAHLQRVAERVGRGELLEWYLVAEGVLCGAVRLKDIEPQNRKAAVAYFLGAEFQGRGIATAAVRFVLRHAFDRLDLNRIELRCATGNAASARVADRLGFVREGELRESEWLGDELVNEYVYSLLRSEFRTAT